MSPILTEIYRHPVKSLGEEALEAVELTPGRPLPWDRVWAIGHGRTAWRPGRSPWEESAPFVTQTYVPRLAQIVTSFDESSGRLMLRHPDLPVLEVTPGDEDDDAALTDWVAPLTEGTVKAGPFSVCRAPVAFTDFEETHVSIASIASRRALEELAGRALEPVRFRMNLWLDGLDPWAELDLVGREIEIGETRLRIIDRVARCNATTADPQTGERNAPVPSLLKRTFGHTDFGVYAQVVVGGTARRGDAARLA